MVDADTVTYNYDVIEECVNKMAKFAQKVEDYASELETRTKKLMAGHWDGVAAQDYESRSQDMKKSLDGIKEAVNGLQGKVSTGAEQLREADKAGSN